MYAGSCAKQFEIAIIHVSTFPDINTVEQNVHSIRIKIFFIFVFSFTSMNISFHQLWLIQL